MPELLTIPQLQPISTGSEFGISEDRSGSQKEYKLLSQLSNGGQGQVYICRRLRSGEEFAVKIIDRQALQRSQRNEVLLRREIRTLRELQHHNVVSLLDAFWESGSCYIVMPLAKEGDLREKVTMHVGLGKDSDSSEYASRHVSRQLVSGINYMHQRRVIHRDLKVENILVAASRPAPEPLQQCVLYTVQITDFGLATWLDIAGEEMTPCGTPNYLAPEVMSDSYDERVDFWSFGVVMYILVCGDFPFDAYHNPADVERVVARPVKEPPSWVAVSALAKSFVLGLLNLQPEQRLSHGGCLRHPWLAEQSLFDEESAAALVKQQKSEASANVCGAVLDIIGRTGAAVDSLRLSCRDGAVQEFGSHGGWTESRFALAHDEVVLAVSQETRNVGSVHLGNSLAFFTSSCNVFELQGTDARTRGCFVAPLGSEIVGLQFNGSRLVGIHLQEVVESVSENGDPQAGSVAEISGRCGFAVDQAVLKLRSGKTREYGGYGGQEHGPWALGDNEFIVIVEQAQRLEYLGNSLVFYTSAGNVYRLAGMEASYSRRFAAAAGSQISGVYMEDGVLKGVKTCARHSDVRPAEAEGN